MRFTYPESVGVEDLEVAVRPIADVLRSEGIDRVTSLTITFHGWREDTCYLMADKGGFIHTMNIPSPSHGNEQEGMTYALPEGAVMKERPPEYDNSPLPAMMGRDV